MLQIKQCHLVSELRRSFFVLDDGVVFRREDVVEDVAGNVAERRQVLGC